MGAGKTTVGRRCADLLGRPFVDTDDLVVAATGLPVADVFARHGEPHFREIERAVVADACASPEPLVLACGGGTVVDAENRRRLRSSGVIVWLRAPVAVLAARVGDGAGRPLLGGRPEAALRRLDALRAAVYEAAAHATVETEALDVDAAAKAVVAAYEEAAA